MTLQHNSLGDKLNQVKNKKETPEEQKNITQKQLIREIFDSGLLILLELFKSLIYGYSINIIFNQHWNFIGFLCVGLSINFLLQFFYGLIHK